MLTSGTDLPYLTKSHLRYVYGPGSPLFFNLFAYNEIIEDINDIKVELKFREEEKTEETDDVFDDDVPF